MDMPAKEQQKYRYKIAEDIFNLGGNSDKNEGRMREHKLSLYRSG
jgi:hypothetical protein